MTEVLIAIVALLLTTLLAIVSYSWYSTKRQVDSLERVLGDLLEDLQMKRKKLRRNYESQLDIYRRMRNGHGPDDSTE